MNRTRKQMGIIVGILLLSFNLIRGVEQQQTKKGIILIPDRISEVIKIDGELDEQAWGNTPINADFSTYIPVYGQPLGHNTSVWMAYDSQNLYFAFKCYDSEPNRIMTSIAQRDYIIGDDWVGLAIDTVGNKLSSYELYVNPNGIQEDGVTSAVNVTSIAINISPMDNAPDLVWQSAGKKTAEGYQVEMCIPLDSIRYKRKKDAKMGIIFKRNVPRLGRTCAWPEINVGQSEFNSMATIIYSDLKKSLNLEVLPNFTYSLNREKVNEEKWGDKEISRNLGFSLKYGITSSITAEATVKPDFSQVESDAYQVEVNQRYPIFYNEKRPFFMEGMNAFDFGVVYQGNMVSTVYTRWIIEPDWAVKVSGTTGKMLFAALAANDQGPGQLFEGDENPHKGKDAYWGIARFKYNLGSDNSLGFIYSGRFFAGGENNVFGTDIQYRFLKNARVKLSGLLTSNQEPEDQEKENGTGLTAQLEYLTQKFTAWITYERHDQHFKMYSAFLNRENISQGTIFLSPNFYVKSQNKWFSWLQNIQPYIRYARIHDFGTGMDDQIIRIGVNFFTAWNGYFKILYRDEQEAWAGKLLRPKFMYYFWRVQPTKWLYLSGAFTTGPKINYSEEDPFIGTGHNIALVSGLQLGTRLNISTQYIHDVLYKKNNGSKEKIYSEDIMYFLATYQFNKYFFLRGLVQYTDYKKEILTDFLASFTLIPGTVMHLGYGSLYENKTFQNNEWITGNSRYFNSKNSLFFKVSYLWRIK